MRKEWILTDDEYVDRILIDELVFRFRKKKKRRQIEENRRRKQKHVNTQDSPPRSRKYVSFIKRASIINFNFLVES